MKIRTLWVFEYRRRLLLSVLFAAVLPVAVPVAWADAPCGELDECRVYIEINARDGDIGFHVLFDAEGWREARITDPNGIKVFEERAHGGVRGQKLTENFFESAEPVCEASLLEPGEDDGEVVTLPEFLERFPAGFYQFRNKLEGGEEIAGSTILTHTIPAAPAGLAFDGSVVSWHYDIEEGLGECTTLPEGFTLAGEGNIGAYEVVLEPEEFPEFTFSVRVPATVTAVSVPAEFLGALPAGTPLKVEVGAIELRPNGSLGNQTFSEEDGFCNSVGAVCVGE